MIPPYRLYGAELSPYSVKVRSYLRYAGIPHEWIPRSAARQGEFQKYAKLPLIPLIVGADEEAMQDSTPIILKLEADGAASITPDDAALAFVSALLEDYADEWLNKAMFHYRWTYEADQKSAAERIAALMLDGQAGDRAPVEAMVRERMTGRLHFVGSHAGTLPEIEGSFLRLIDVLEAHLAEHSYLLGARPALADFGIACQLYQLLSDPTPGAILRARTPRVVAWVERMDRPSAEGSFESFDRLRPALVPLLREVARTYAPWMPANAAAAAANAESFSVEIGAAPFTQAPQKYAARAWAEIQRKHAAVRDPRLDALLAETGLNV